MVETARLDLDADELAALDAIVAFIRDCLADPEVPRFREGRLEALILAEVRADARSAAT